MEEIAEGIDESTGEFASQSIAGILRKNSILVNMAVGQDLDINYDTVIRDEQLLTDEVEVTCTVEELLMLTGRS